MIIIIKMMTGKGEGANRGKTSKEIYLGVKGSRTEEEDMIDHCYLSIIESTIV